MGFSEDYSDVPEWEEQPQGYTEGSMVKYQGNIFKAAFWASKPGDGTPDTNGWRHYDELYDQTNARRTEKAKIIAYLPTWRVSENFDYASPHIYRYATHCIVAFLMFDEENLGRFSKQSLTQVKDVIHTVAEAGRRSETKVLIALGGATDYGFLFLLQEIGRNPSDPRLEIAAEEVHQFVTGHDLDGVDLDLECWWDKNGNPENDQGGRLQNDAEHTAGYGLSVFAKRLRQKMPEKIISAAFFATSWYGNNYPLIDELDWMGIMTYDLTGSWNNSPVGPHSALYKVRDLEKYLGEQHNGWPQANPNRITDTPMSDNPILSVEDSIWYWTNPYFVNWQGKGQNLSRNKIAAGVPLYGYDFAYPKDPDDLSGQVPPGYKAVRYKDILNQFPSAATAEGGNIKVSGSTSHPTFTKGSGSYPYKHNIYFETPSMAREKLEFLKRLGTQGVILWEISNDSSYSGTSIAEALYKASGNGPKDLLLPLSTAEDAVAQIGRNDREGKLDSAMHAAFTYRISGNQYLYSQNSTSYKWTIRRVTDKGEIGSVVDEGEWGNMYNVLVPYSINGRHYFFGHKVSLTSGNVDAGYWFIQELRLDGTMGDETSSGQWNNAYHVCLYFSVGGKHYIFGHKAEYLTVHDETIGTVDTGYWFIQELLPGGLMGEETDTGQWNNPYHAMFAFQISGRQFIYGQKVEDRRGTVDRNYWFIQEVRRDGTMGEETDTGQWRNAYHVQFPFQINGSQYFYGQKIRDLSGGNVDVNWWFIQELLPGGQMGEETDADYAKASYEISLPLEIDGRPFIFGYDASTRDWISREITLMEWISQVGDNGYSYNELTHEMTNMRQHILRKPIRVLPRVSYLIAVLSKNRDSRDYPEGVILQIHMPDGGTPRESRQVSVVEGKGGLQALIIKEPPSGLYNIQLNIPEGVEYRFSMECLPFMDMIESIEEKRTLNKRSLPSGSSGGSVVHTSTTMALMYLISRYYPSFEAHYRHPREPIYLLMANQDYDFLNRYMNAAPLRQFLENEFRPLTTQEMQTPPPTGQVVQRQSGLAGPSIYTVHNNLGALQWIRTTIQTHNLDTGTGTNNAMRQFARQLGLPTDQAGHVVARRLGGVGTDQSFIFPINQRLNGGRFSSFLEDTVYRMVQNTGSADLYIRLIYADPNYPTRPSRIECLAVNANGVELRTNFFNAEQ